MKKTYNRPIVKTMQLNCSPLMSASLTQGDPSNSGVANSNRRRDVWSSGWD